MLANVWNSTKVEAALIMVDKGSKFSRFLLTPTALNDPVTLTWRPIMRRDLFNAVSETGDSVTVRFAKSELEGKTHTQMMMFFTDLFKVGRIPVTVTGMSKTIGMTWVCTSTSGGLLNMPLAFAALFGFASLTGADINSDNEYEFVEGAYKTFPTKHD
jgi:hypothetical protein